MRARTILFASVCAGLLTASANQCLHAQNAAAPQAAGPAYQDSANDLSVSVGKTVLVDTAQPIARVSVGIGDVAMATAVSPTELMINGRTPGETSLIIWDIHGGRQFYNISVHPSRAAADSEVEIVRRELRQEMPDQPVHIALENGTVFLRGTVKDLTSAERAVKIASVAGKVVNLLDVQVPSSDPQILLKVRFASVDRSLIKSMGINFFDLGLGNVIGGITTGQFSPPYISGSGGSTGATGLSSSSAQASLSNELNLLAFFPGLKSGADIQALEQQGMVQLLAEPNLLATNGKQASFLAGGEYPYPVVQGTSAGGSTAVSIQFKEYGIRLNFLPTITPRGTIRLQVAPEVSALDYSNQVQISGFVVPGITTRTVNTEVELRDHQSFVIGGLLDNTVTQTFEKIPFVGDIPILGKFFQSIQRTKNNSELIVIVTPELVAPIPAGQQLPSLKYPMAFMPPNSTVPMHTPDGGAAAVKPEPAPAAIPMEKLIDSMKPETPLTIEGASGQFGAGSGSMSGSATSGAPSQ
jgi:pilus assembly protein CpaC